MQMMLSSTHPILAITNVQDWLSYSKHVMFGTSHALSHPSAGLYLQMNFFLSIEYQNKLVDVPQIHSSISVQSVTSWHLFRTSLYHCCTHTVIHCTIHLLEKDLLKKKNKHDTVFLSAVENKYFSILLKVSNK